MRGRGSDRLYAQYGPGAVVAGGSDGIGFSIASLLAEAGFDVVLLARREAVLNQAASALRERYEAAVHTDVVDLSEKKAVDVIVEWMIRANAGLLVYNAAASPVGPFIDQTASELDSVLSVNCAGVLRAAHSVLPLLAERGLEEGVRGGLILMSSLSGLRGAAGIAAYAASKSFIETLGEALWMEGRERDIDVVTCLAGATDTPTYHSQSPTHGIPLMGPDRVARRVLRSLGRRPVTIPGIGNRVASTVLGRVLPRIWGIRLLSHYTKS